MRNLKIKGSKRFNIILGILFFTVGILVFGFFFKTTGTDVEAQSCPPGCSWNAGFAECVGPNGCVWVCSDGSTTTNPATCPGGYATGHECDPCVPDCGSCGGCTPPACPSYYTETNTGCSTTSTSCTRYDDCGSCGTYSRTCYLVKYTLTYSAGAGGTLSGTTSQSICRSSNGTAVTANPSGGYYFVNWSDGSTANPRTDTAVTTNITVTANFAVSNVAPSAPTSLLAEGVANPTGVVDLTPEFSAIFNDSNTGNTGIHYQIQVNTNSAFTGTVMWDSGQIGMTATAIGARSPNIAYAGTALSLNGTTYYWRIRFWDNLGAAGTWSSAANFTMNTAPAAPTSLLTESATNPSGLTDTTPEFSAIFNDPNTGNTGTNYEIEVNTNSAFTGTVMWDSGQIAMTATAIGARSPNISYAGTALSLNGTTYYWRIRFTDNNGTTGSWSSTANFTMNTPPTAPTSLLSEGQTNPVGVTDTTPELSAIFNDSNSGDTGTYYEIEVNTNSAFTGTVMWDSGQVSMTTTAIGVRSPNISYAGTALSLNGTTYHWRIRFTDNTGTIGDWSSTANFTMNTPPTAPTSLFTEQETDPTGVTDTTPELSAIFNDPNSGDTATHYEIEVNTNSSFTGTVMWDSGQVSTSSIAIGARSPDIAYNGTPLSLNGITYYWRIRFTDIYGTVGAWSATANFRMVDKPNTVSNLSAVALSTDTIRWSFTDNSNSEEGVKIYDTNGTLLKTCIGVDLTHCDESGLEENVQYTRKFTAYNSEAESDFSTTVSRYTLLSRPSSPTEDTKTHNSITVDALAQPNFPEYYFECQTNCSGDVNTWTQLISVQASILTGNTPYTFRIKARNGDDIETEYSDPITIYTLSGVPVLTADTLSNTSISLTASNVNNLASGQSGLYFECVDPLTCNSGIQEWIKSDSDIVIGLEPNTQYGFRVKTRNYEALETAWSDIHVLYTHASIPSISEVSTIDYDSLSISVQNSNNPSTTEVLIQETTTGKYVSTNTQILETDPQWIAYGAVPPVITLNGLNSGTTYTFNVKARNTINEETAYSSTVSGTTQLSNISALAPTVESDTSITWEIGAYTNEILGIKVYDSGNNLIKTCLGTDIHTCIETGLTPNTAYTRKLTIFNNLTESTYTSSVTATTFANTPVLLDIQLDDYTSNSVTVHINPTTNPTPTEYLIQEDVSGYYLNPETELLQSTPYYATYEEFGSLEGINIYGLIPNTQYQFKIKGRNSDSIETGFSSLKSVLTLAALPSIANVTAIDNSSMKVSIDSSTNPSTTELLLLEQTTGMYLDPLTGILQTEPVWKDIPSWGGINGITIENLSTNTLYTFSIKARNGNNIETEYSQTLGKYTRSTNLTLTSDVISPTSIELTIDLNGNPVTTHYQIQNSESEEYVDTNGNFIENSIYITQDSTEAKITLESLSVNTTYTFNIRSKNLNDLVEEWSTPISITTWANTPSELLFEGISGDKGKISFNNNGNPNNTLFAIQEVNSGKYIDNGKKILTNDISWGTYESWGLSSGITVQGLEPGKAYTFRIKAQNSEDVETVYVGSNTAKTYSVIVNKPENVDIVLSSNENIDVSTVQGAQRGTQNVRVKQNNYLVADIPISFESNRDWSSVVLQSDPSKNKAVVKLGSTHGFTTKFTLYVVSGNSNTFRICPKAESLNDITPTCSNSVLYTGPFPQTKTIDNNSVTVSKAQIGGTTYWISDGLTGTGGQGEYVEDKIEEDDKEEEVPVDETDEEEEVPNNPVIPTRNIFTNINQVVEGVITKTINTLDKTSLGNLSQEELTSVAATTTVITVSVATTATLGGVSQVGYALVQVVVNVLNALGFRRKRYPSGYVYDAVTREPVKQAIVRVFTPTHKLVESSVTDNKGIFWSSIQEGEYMIEVKKRDFDFPSQLILGNEDYPLTNIYHGETTAIKKGNVQIVIPIDPQTTASYSKALTLFRGIFSLLIPVLNILLFVIGIIITAYVYIKFPSNTNILLGLLYIPATIVLVKSIFNLSGEYGKITFEDGTPAEKVTILLKEKDFGKVVEKRVTDKKGRYYFDIKEKGEYILEIFDTNISVVKGETTLNSKGNTKVRNKLIVKRI